MISPPDDAGFTIIELIVALVILTVGLLAFAGTTVFLIRQVTVAQLTTARTMAVGINQVLAAWNPSVVGVLPLFQPLALTGTIPGAAWEVDVRRLSDRSYFLDARATVVERGMGRPRSPATPPPSRTPTSTPPPSRSSGT